MPCAARLGDQVLHSQALPQAKSSWWHGLLKGALVGAAIVAVSAVAVAVTVGTGGFGAPFAIGAAAVIIGSGLRYAQVGFHEGAQAGAMQGTRAGPIKTGSRNVYINGKAAALACLSLVSCQQHGDGKKVAQGSETVWINGHRLARVGDEGECGFVIGEGSPNVFAGAPPASCHGLTVGSEIPQGLSDAVDTAGKIGGYMELAGGLLMGGPALLNAFKSVAGVLSLGFVGGLGYGGSRLATDYAKSHGWSASGQMMAGDFGGLGGSLVGGGMLAGGARLLGRTPVVPETATISDPPVTQLSQPGGLKATEGTQITRPNGSLGSASHPLANHGLDKPLSVLDGPNSVEQRMINNTKMGNSTKFTDRATMETAIGKTIDAKTSEINAWLSTNPPAGSNMPAISGYDPQMGNLGAGYSRPAPGAPYSPSGPLNKLTVVLKSNGAGGYVIQTAFPER